MADMCAQGVDTGFAALSYAQVAILGVVQGITELLPISSTAHMRIVPAVLGWPDPGAAFSAAMQMAALAAVISYFWRDVRDLTVGSVQAAVKRDFGDRHLRLAILIILGTIPIVIGGALLAKTLNACGSPLRTINAIGWACVVMAVLLALAEIFAKHKRTLENVTWVDALVVGVAQVGALIPGVSRSGSTLTAALGRGLERGEAARFSFLLGLPAIALAGLRELVALHGAHLDHHGWWILAVGLVVSSISAFVAIWGLMRILEKFSAWPFVVYRAVLGVVLIVGAARGLIV
jgi:undecaprenyl-diphosphatase